MQNIFSEDFVSIQKSKLRKRIDETLSRRNMGERKLMATEEAEFSYQLRDRRKLYRRLDYLLLYFHIRNIPKECGLNECSGSCPGLGVVSSADGFDSTNAAKDEERSALERRKEELRLAEETVWKATFTECALLIRHDDTLNWQKFHYMLLVFGALFSGYVFAFKEGKVNGWICLVIGFAGMVLAWGADLTFQEGLRCLRAHRRKLNALEKRAPPYQTTFLFSKSAYNQRDGLEAGPVVMFCVSFCLTLNALGFMFLGSDPEKKLEHEIKTSIDQVLKTWLLDPVNPGSPASPDSSGHPHPPKAPGVAPQAALPESNKEKDQLEPGSASPKDPSTPKSAGSLDEKKASEANKSAPAIEEASKENKQPLNLESKNSLDH